MAVPMVRAVILGLLLAVATLALVVYAVLSAFAHECEVCVAFHGRTACRRAAGSTAEEALRTAQDNACAFVASGMTETVECTTRPAASATCTP